MSERREDTLSRKRCGMLASGEGWRLGRVVWVSGARAASLYPSLHASLDCPYKYRNGLCALRSLGDAVCPASTGHWGSAALPAIPGAEGAPLGAPVQRDYQAGPHPAALGGFP